MKRNLPQDLFAVMASDPDPSVRMSIAANAKAPLELVAQLAKDPDGNVSRVAAFNLDKRQQKLARKNAKLR